MKGSTLTRRTSSPRPSGGGPAPHRRLPQQRPARSRPAQRAHPHTHRRRPTHLVQQSSSDPPHPPRQSRGSDRPRRPRARPRLAARLCARGSATCGPRAPPGCASPRPACWVATPELCERSGHRQSSTAPRNKRSARQRAVSPSRPRPAGITNSMPASRLHSSALEKSSTPARAGDPVIRPCSPHLSARPPPPFPGDSAREGLRPRARNARRRPLEGRRASSRPSRGGARPSPRL